VRYEARHHPDGGEKQPFGPFSDISRTAATPGHDHSSVGELIERTAEVAAVQEMLGGAAAGAGRSLVVSGPAGIGKSALAAHARDVARAAGFVVLTSTATPVSTMLSHGVVRDWLGPRARAGRPGLRPFDGPAAGLAEALREAAPAHQAWNLASLDYAVTWVLESLADTQPLLLVVDDAQWADLGSLQFLDLLSARLPQLPAALLLAVRAGEASAAPAILDRLAGRASGVEPAPLSPAGVEEVRRRHAASLHPAVSADELHRLTGGVPFLLHELLRAESLDAAPRGVVASVRERLDRLGQVAVRVARAVAVLGEDAALDAVAGLTGLSVAELAGPLDLLGEAGIVEVRTWQIAPAHPLVAEAILSGMGPQERSDLHRAAAAHLTDRGRPARVIASHLLHTLPAEDPSVVAVLRAAGEESLRSGASEVAARQLLRAAEETRPENTDPELVALAASAHLQAGHRTRGLDLWTVALDRAVDPVRLAGMLADMAHVQMTMGERAAAATAYQRAVAVLSEAGHDATSPQMRGVLVRAGLSTAMYEGAREDIVSAVRAAYGQPAETDTHDDRLLFAVAAADLSLRATDRLLAQELALRALGDGALLAEETSDGYGFYVASGVLSWCDAYEENLRALEQAIADARCRGSLLGFATASFTRGLVRYRTGRLRDAVTDFQSALDLRRQGWADFAAHAVAGAALTHLALGQGAEALVLEPDLRAVARRGGLASAQPLATAGIVRAMHGDHEQALADYRAAAAMMGEHPDNASIVDWRELCVWSLLALGRRDEARELAEVATERAREWGAPRAVGFALRTLARTAERDEALDMLREAIALFGHCGALDYRSRAWLDLGGLLLGGGQAERDEAVSVLRAALDHGRWAGVEPVVGRATRLLGRAGVTVADPTGAAAPALTPGERRVAELAAGGATNREIAQKLFVTVKAVEWHLSNAYRKLGIGSRRDLPSALYGESGPSSSSEM
jgi:DNA-binding CsgD family transcriptional regulator/tetratricopeptide (TPR) repeat protein